MYPVSISDKCSHKLIRWKTGLKCFSINTTATCNCYIAHAIAASYRTPSQTGNGSYFLKRFQNMEFDWHYIHYINMKIFVIYMYVKSVMWNTSLSTVVRLIAQQWHRGTQCIRIQTDYMLAHHHSPASKSIRLIRSLLLQLSVFKGH